MPINSSIGIRGSVGQGGRNNMQDVMVIQQRLNDLMHSPRVPLKMDGRSGPKTEGMIRDFQKVVLGMTHPDGRVDPMGQTLRALNDPSSEGKWARMSFQFTPSAPERLDTMFSPTATAERAASLLQQEALITNATSTFDEIRRGLIDTGFPPFKSFLGSVTKVEEARALLGAWKILRGFGFSPAEAAEFYNGLSKMKPDHAKTFLALAAKPGSKVAAGLSKLSNVAGKAALAVTLIEVADKFQQGDYLYGASEMYKQYMSKAIPWAGGIEALQSIVEGVLPGNAKVGMVFKTLRACDPIGLGAVGVDAVGTLSLGVVHMIQTGQIDEARLNRLVDRMKSGPAAFFAHMGERLGGSLYEMSEWKSDDWGYAVRSIPGFIRSLF